MVSKFKVVGDFVEDPSPFVGDAGGELQAPPIILNLLQNLQCDEVSNKLKNFLSLRLDLIEAFEELWRDEVGLDWRLFVGFDGGLH